MARLIVSASNRMTRVSIALRSGGGVSRLEMSRMPSRLMCRVRGIGVAERVRTSTVVRSVLSHSLSSTPNRCSSSMITRPRSLKATSFCRMRWVPIRMSTAPAGGALQDVADLGLGPEAVDDLDREGKLGHARGEAAMVLLGEDGGGHEHGDLLAGVDGLEGRADGDLGLAVADVAADQAVHRLALGHVALDGLDGRELVGRLLVGERRLELGHPVAVLGRDRRIPAGCARWAWMSISSCARSTTASATRFFRFSQVDEPIFESVGSALPPPTYFCTRSILAIGT